MVPFGLILRLERARWLRMIRKAIRTNTHNNYENGDPNSEQPNILIVSGIVFHKTPCMDMHRFTQVRYLREHTSSIWHQGIQLVCHAMEQSPCGGSDLSVRNQKEIRTEMPRVSQSSAQGIWKIWRKMIPPKILVVFTLHLNYLSYY